MRKRQPAWLRKGARLVRHAAARPIASPSLPPELFADCRVCASRAELVARLPKQGIVGEVGTLRGDFAKVILGSATPRALHLIDLEFGALDAAVARNTIVTLHRGDSALMLQSFPDAFFDWLYIDANHAYAAVRRDCAAAAPKIKPGGYLVFNDFAHIDPHLGAYGVHRAVCEFAQERGWPFRWLSYDPYALYDVALQRPE
jgi:predicted O-methyltransferase YrrM